MIKSLTDIMLHDLFTIKGGGERLVMTLCQGLEADLLTGAVGQDSFDLSEIKGTVTDLKVPLGVPGLRTVSLSRAFKNLSLNDAHNNAIYSGVCAPLARNQVEAKRHVFYCHTPPRFVYDKVDHYAQQLNWPARQAMRLLNAWFKPQYEQAVNSMDVVLTNSQYVQRRIKHHLKLDSEVVYPPCDTQRFQCLGQSDYYLSLARLDGLKRVDAIVDAFKRMPDKKLVVASGGSELKALQLSAQAHDNIQFTGWVDDEQMLQLLGHCIATIYVPLDEDFGMSPVESMSAGKPVICSDHGGPLESVVVGETGVAVASDDLSHGIIEAVHSLTQQKAIQMRTACEHRAEQFDSKRFIQHIEKYLN